MSIELLDIGWIYNNNSNNNENSNKIRVTYSWNGWNGQFSIMPAWKPQHNRTYENQIKSNGESKHQIKFREKIIRIHRREWIKKRKILLGIWARAILVVIYIYYKHYM